MSGSWSFEALKVAHFCCLWAIIAFCAIKELVGELISEFP